MFDIFLSWVGMAPRGSFVLGWLAGWLGRRRSPSFLQGTRPRRARAPWCHYGRCRLPARVQQRDGVIHAPTGVRGGYATYFLRAYAGAPVAQTLRLSLLRCGERLYDTLRALPENVATPYAYWSKRAVLFTLRWRDNTAPW